MRCTYCLLHGGCNNSEVCYFLVPLWMGVVVVVERVMGWKEAVLADVMLHGWVFNIHGSVHHNNILIYIQQDATLHSLFYLETALHVSGGTSPIIMSTNNCIYSIWYLSHCYCYLPLSWKSWNWFWCAVGGVRPLPGIAGSNPAEGMAVCWLVLRVVK
jgi:hypothetical protein